MSSAVTELTEQTTVLRCVLYCNNRTESEVNTSRIRRVCYFYVAAVWVTTPSSLVGGHRRFGDTLYIFREEVNSLLHCLRLEIRVEFILSRGSNRLIYFENV